MDVLNTLSDIGIVPVIAIDDADKAVELARALARGGIPAAEITFRTTAGQEAIRKVAAECPDILVGAGTVITVDQVRSAVEGGAKFIVSPGYYDEVVDYCVKNGITVMPGCSNPSDMMKAVNAGLKAVKVFPAGDLGGLAFIKSVASVFPLKFMPTGGISMDNMVEYLSNDKICAVGGTWTCKKDMINAGRFGEITAICRSSVTRMLGLSIVHVGINCGSAEEAEKVAGKISTVFGMEYKPGNSSDFAGTSVECMKSEGLGKNGHIAIGTNCIERAVYHLSKAGIEFDESTRKYDRTGRLKAIYLKDEIGGFAFHLMQR